MDCKEILIRKLLTAVDQFEFSTWENGELGAGPTGAMRISGMVAESERFFIIENVENTVEEGGIIQNVVKIVGKPDIKEWVRIGNGISLVITDDKGNFDVQFGELLVPTRGKTRTLKLDRKELIEGGYLPAKAKKLTETALLYKVVDSIPKDLLFSTLEGLKELFGLPAGTQRLFVTETWRHPTSEDIYGGRRLSPTDFPDLMEMVDALCEGRTKLNLPDEPTTDWRYQVAHKD